jgi:uncharacterized protein YjiS (DUF1127 family)
MFRFRKPTASRSKNLKLVALRSMNSADLADIGMKPGDLDRLVERLRLLDQ